MAPRQHFMICHNVYTVLLSRAIPRTYSRAFTDGYNTKVRPRVVLHELISSLFAQAKPHSFVKRHKRSLTLKCVQWLLTARQRLTSFDSYILPSKFLLVWLESMYDFHIEGLCAAKRWLYLLSVNLRTYYCACGANSLLGGRGVLEHPEHPPPPAHPWKRHCRLCASSSSP